MILWLSQGMAASMQVLLAPDGVEGIPEGCISTIGMSNVSIDQALGSLGGRENAGKGQESKGEGLHDCFYRGIKGKKVILRK